MIKTIDNEGLETFISGVKAILYELDAIAFSQFIINTETLKEIKASHWVIFERCLEYLNEAKTKHESEYTIRRNNHQPVLVYCPDCNADHVSCQICGYEFSTRIKGENNE